MFDNLLVYWLLFLVVLVVVWLLLFLMTVAVAMLLSLELALLGVVVICTSKLLLLLPTLLPLLLLMSVLFLLLLYSGVTRGGVCDGAAATPFQISLIDIAARGGVNLCWHTCVCRLLMKLLSLEGVRRGILTRACWLRDCC